MDRKILVAGIGMHSAVLGLLARGLPNTEIVEVVNEIPKITYASSKVPDPPMLIPTIASVGRKPKKDKSKLKRGSSYFNKRNKK